MGLGYEMVLMVLRCDFDPLNENDTYWLYYSDAMLSAVLSHLCQIQCIHTI
jgi:hypothetical protein